MSNKVVKLVDAGKKSLCPFDHMPCDNGIDKNKCQCDELCRRRPKVPKKIKYRPSKLKKSS